jgi:hypothetical protein
MSEKLENLVKDLASGMSRRTAFRRLFSGLAGAAFLLLTGRRASADAGNNVCVSFCLMNYSGQHATLGQCISNSTKCPVGQCSFLITCSDDTAPPCVPQSEGGSGQAWICVQVS